MTKLPEYNPDGKKLTFAQHQKKMRDLEEKRQKQKKEEGGLTPGTCPECGKGSFTHRCEPGGTIIRTCKQCGSEKSF